MTQHFLRFRFLNKLIFELYTESFNRFGNGTGKNSGTRTWSHVFIFMSSVFYVIDVTHIDENISLIWQRSVSPTAVGETLGENRQTVQMLMRTEDLNVEMKLKVHISQRQTLTHCELSKKIIRRKLWLCKKYKRNQKKSLTFADLSPCLIGSSKLCPQRSDGHQSGRTPSCRSHQLAAADGS